ncbi:MAG: glycosyltransferase family 4 protein [Bacteroides sp.]|nr:glycosyltransferase family 4 protein [Bacteroides sp.]
MKRKIVLFCEALRNRAGIERMTVELANLLCDECSVTIITIDPFSDAECPYRIDTRVDVRSLNYSFNKSLFSPNLKNIRALRNILKEVRPSVVIAVATPMVRIAVPAARRLGIKTIGWEHFNIFAGSKIGALYKALAPWMVQDTVVLTEADAVDYRKFLAPRITVIPNFTSIGVNAPSDCSSKILLAVGRHAYQKGFDMLIKAWAKTDAPGWKLRIVGSGADREANERLAEELGLGERIEFKDSTPAIAEEFRQASCFVLSSRFEGLVLVLIEAKMMGLPTVCFDCPNSPREVVRDGVDGILIPPADIEALAHGLTDTLKDSQRLAEMGAKGREDAMLRYSPEAIKKLWLNLIEF